MPIGRPNREVNAGLQLSDIQVRSAAAGSGVCCGTPKWVREYLKPELVKYDNLVKPAGIKAEGSNKVTDFQILVRYG